MASRSSLVRRCAQSSRPNPVSVMNASGRWRARGEVIRALSQGGDDPTVRKMMLTMAANCDRFAKRAARVHILD
jgi:hypothetical protein